MNRPDSYLRQNQSPIILRNVINQQLSLRQCLSVGTLFSIRTLNPKTRLSLAAGYRIDWLLLIVLIFIFLRRLFWRRGIRIFVNFIKRN